MIEESYTVTGVVHNMHTKTGELVYWEREAYTRNGTSCVIKSYINQNMHIMASFTTRSDAEQFEAFRIEATTPMVDAQEG